jgi:hypothetical protein
MLGSWWDRLEGQIYQNATLVFTMSSHITRSVVEDYACPEAKVRCIYVGNNVPVTADFDTGLERYRRRAILFVGVNWRRKRGNELAAAFKRLLPRHPEATLTVVGCAPRMNLPGVGSLAVFLPQRWPNITRLRRSSVCQLIWRHLAFLSSRRCIMRCRRLGQTWVPSPTSLSKTKPDTECGSETWMA